MSVKLDILWVQVALNNKYGITDLRQDRIRPFTANIVSNAEAIVTRSPDLISWLSQQLILEADFFPRYIFIGEINVWSNTQIYTQFQGYKSTLTRVNTRGMVLIDHIQIIGLTQENGFNMSGYLVDRQNP